METLHYHSLEKLRALSLSELRGLWELVPTDRQRGYKAAYERELRAAGAEGSDIKERRVNLALMQRYNGSALIPLGRRWARAPQWVQAAAMTAAPLESDDKPAPKAGQPSGKWLAVVGLLMVGMMAAFLMRGNSQSDDRDQPTATPTLSPDITPTPLALEAQDDVIEGGDASRAAFYPVTLQALPADGGAPRVWVVQRRAIRASQWVYDDHPDTASYLNGMSVRPVIGIPWSEENAAWFEGIGVGTAFRVQMNTGALLTFEFEDKRTVLRSETGLFRQVSPGLVLLLIGETDADGFPTATRTLVTAAYPPEQELARSGELIGLPVVVPAPETLPTPTLELTVQPVSGVDVQLVRVAISDGRVTVQVRAYNGGTQPIRVTADDLWLALGYAENPPGPRIPAEGLAAFDLLPGQAADLTLIWPWAGEPFASVGVLGWHWAVEF